MLCDGLALTDWPSPARFYPRICTPCCPPNKVQAQGTFTVLIQPMSGERVSLKISAESTVDEIKAQLVKHVRHTPAIVFFRVCISEVLNGNIVGT